jgi:2-polyprenyl-3-methyl-5-hydroxy-6-metoxy-1,4-benzoquinol methylase
MSTRERDLDNEAASWDQKPGRIRLAADVAAAIRNETIITPDMDALDFGCGTGLLTLQMQPLVRSITGVDSSGGMLDILMSKAREQNLTNVSTQLKDLSRGDGLDGRYHLIMSSMTLHHIREIAPLLHHLSEAMLPGGHLCIADLDPDDGRFHTNNEGVFHFGFDRSILSQAFTEAGFSEIRVQTAATMDKPVPGGGKRTFTVFLMTARKPA